MDYVERLWECPECGIIVKANEVQPPVVMDAERVIERVFLIVKVKNWGRMMGRVYLAMPFLRFGCWLANMDLEVESHVESNE